MIDKKEIRQTITEIRNFANSGFLQPNRAKLLSYARIITQLSDRIEELENKAGDK